MKRLKVYDFKNVNDFVHDIDVEFEDMQGACLELVAEIEKLKKDVSYLLTRAAKAGGIGFGGDRDYGESSNALVHFAFTGKTPTAWPYDESDYKACVLAVKKLPKHRKSEAVFKNLEIAKAKYESRR